MAGIVKPNKSVKGTRRPLAVLELGFFQGSVASFGFRWRHAPYRNVGPQKRDKDMTKIFIPSTGPAGWQALLADPEKHWVTGYSAKTLAHSWEAADGFPPEVASVLSQSPLLKGIVPLFIFPEWKVPLPGGTTESQNDAWVVARCEGGLVSIAVEGKVEEPFGTPIGKWKANASAGKNTRLTYLTEMLGLSAPVPDTVYYQLLHRTASAVIEAQRIGAAHAAMLVHSFSPTNQWFAEFKAFVALFGATAEIGKLSTVKAKNAMPLHLAWVHGDENFRKS
ncbi:MAG: hypothetical protein P1P78_07695 [Methyloprofundus sp.]|nr:hypothetical protein [Methyloprofundus sp.]